MTLHFIRPEWLYAYIPLLCFFVWIKHNKSLHSEWKSYIAPHLAKVMLSTSNTQQRNNLWLIATFLCLGVLALSGPAINKTRLPVFSSEQGRVIIMDMSRSMYANDLLPNRLAQEKFRATDIINGIKDGDTALIAYAGDAFTISPLTNDKNTLLNLLPTLTPQIMPSQGSNLSAAIALAKKLLAQGGHHKGDILLLTDGVNSLQANKVNQLLKNTKYRLAIIAVGTQEGAPIKLPNGDFLRNNQHDLVIAKTNFSQLEKLASNNHGIFLINDNNNINTLSHWLNNSNNGKTTDIKGENWQDLGPYLTILLLFPALLSLRNGFIAICLMAFLYHPNYAAANTWDNLWLNQNQQASQAFKNKQYQQAATLFKDENWQASALYKAGDYQQALEQFKQDNSAAGKYNQGNSFMQLNDYKSAIAAYQSALALQPDFANAKSNLELAKKLLNQQNKQNQQQSNDKQTENKQNQQQQNQGKQAENKKNQQQQSNDKQTENKQNQQQQNQGKQAENKQHQQQQSNDKQAENKQNQQQQNQGKQAENKQHQQQQSNDKQAENKQHQQQQSNDNQAKNKQHQQQQSNDKQAESKKNQQQQDNQAENKQYPQQQNQDKQIESNALSNEAKMQTDPKQNENKETKNQHTSFKNNQAQSAQYEQVANENVPATYKQQQSLPQDMQRALRGVIDDPQVLLRNKMYLEAQKRRLRGEQTEDNEQW